jgi:hypothetical protein
MTNAFSVLSLKRNRSTSTCKSTSEPVSKLSRLKSGFSIFSKFTTQPHQHSTKKNENKHNSFIDFFNQYFRTIDGTVHNHSRLRRKNTYESDKNYEYNQYRREARKKKLALNAERNVYTVPTPKKLKSILIKQSAIPIRNANNSATLTTHSEDLTAKQFADIAGIHILPELDDAMSSQIDDPITVISHVSQRSEVQPKIWENDFWHTPEETVSRNNSLRREPVLDSGPYCSVEPPILHELRRMGTCGSDKSGVIKKGRFEIHLESGKP